MAMEECPSHRCRLSVAMIVRNEEEVLSRSLESVRAIADEIVVLDTGSTDGTPDWIRREVLWSESAEREVALFFRSEDGAQEEMRERAIAATRQLAKRQLTWLRREHGWIWYDLQEGGAWAAINDALKIFLEV